MKRGYLAVWRKIQDHPFYQEKRVFSKYEAWLDILMEVQHSMEPQDVIIGMTVHKCNYGESLKSVGTWARRWKWTDSKVRRFFDLLKKLNQITSKSEGKTTRLSVVNYEGYDPKRRHGDETSTRCRRDADDMPTTDNNEKKEKNVKNKNLTDSPESVEEDFYTTRKKKKLTGKRLTTFETFWAAFDYKKGKADAADAWIDILKLTDSLVVEICAAASREAVGRAALIATGKTPIFAQGWLTGRRWEDDVSEGPAGNQITITNEITLESLEEILN